MLATLGEALALEAGFDELVTDAVGAEFLAVGFEADGLLVRAKAEAAGDAVVEQLDVVVLEFDDFAAVDADEVVVRWGVVVVRVVGGLITAEVDFYKQACFCQQGERAIESGA